MICTFDMISFSTFCGVNLLYRYALNAHYSFRLFCPLSTQDTQQRVWGACLFVVVTDLDVTSFTFTQIQKAVDMK